MKTNSSPQQKKGFALLLTLIVVSVIISIGLSVLDLSILQVRLSTNSKDSEVSFHAANAGMECAQYWRRTESNRMEGGQAISPTCFDANTYSNSRTTITSGANGSAYQYRYSFTWPGSVQRCTQINTIVIAAALDGNDLTVNNMTSYIPGYPGNTSRTCVAGETCTIISAQGFNKTCAAVQAADSNDTFGIVSREVLLQF